MAREKEHLRVCVYTRMYVCIYSVIRVAGVYVTQLHKGIYKGLSLLDVFVYTHI